MEVLLIPLYGASSLIEKHRKNRMRKNFPQKGFCGGVWGGAFFKKRLPIVSSYPSYLLLNCFILPFSAQIKGCGQKRTDDP